MDGAEPPQPWTDHRPPTAAHWGSRMTPLLSRTSATLFSFLLFSASFFLLPPICPHAGSRPECGNAGMTAEGLPESESCTPACAVLPPTHLSSSLFSSCPGCLCFSMALSTSHPYFLFLSPSLYCPVRLVPSFWFIPYIHSANSDIGASTGRDTDCGAIRRGLCSKRVVDPAMLSPHPSPQCPEQCLARSKHSINGSLVESEGLIICTPSFLLH